MKTFYLILFLLAVSFISAISQEKMPNLKYIRYIDSVDCSNITGRTVSLGDTLIFFTNNYKTQESFLNIYYHNKYLRFSKQELGINDLNGLTLNDALHCNKNKNELWLATKYGLLIYDGEKWYFNNEFSKFLKDSTVNSFYKDTNGNIYINLNTPSLIFYDGTHFIKLDNTGDPWQGPCPGTKMIGYNDRIYYVTITYDIGYYDIKSKTYNVTGLRKLIDSLYVEKITPTKKCYIQTSILLLKNKIYFTVTNVKREKMFSYDGTNLEIDNFIADGILKNDTLIIISQLYFDSKGRKWVEVTAQKDINDKYSIHPYHFVIDSNNQYKTINIYDYDTTMHGISGLHEFSNGLIYCGFMLLGFLVEDPLGLSVEEVNSTPSFFLTTVKPNPFKNKTRVEIVGTQKAIDNMKVEIFDYLGKSIRKLEPFIIYYPSTGNATLDLETEGILPGFYYLVLNDGNDTRTMPIIVK